MPNTSVNKRKRQTLLYDLLETSTSDVTSKAKRLKQTLALMERKTKVRVIQGNVLNATEDFIAHQCNCITSYAKGLAKSIFKRFPESNVYTNRVRMSPRTHHQPGTISVHGRIINMFAQQRPGKNTIAETQTQRLQWFQQCLKHIANLPHVQSIAMPYGIGCGLAGGNWPSYKKYIDSFSITTGIKVVLYKLQ